MSKVTVGCTLAAMIACGAAHGAPQTAKQTETVKGKLVVFGLKNPDDSTSSLAKAITRDGSIETVSLMESAVWWPRVSPDGKCIAYVAERDGQTALRLLTVGSRQTSSIAPTEKTAWIGGWSPDGTKIIFGHGDRCNRTNFIVTIATRDIQQISLPKSELVWDWSPDGKELLTISEPELNEPRQINRANLDGTGLVCLTNRTTDNLYPRFSPDGTKILFSSTRTRRSHAYVMTRDGKDALQLTSFDNRSTGFGCWSPDGKEICCRSYMTGPVDDEGSYSVSDAHLVLMNADGSDPKDFVPPSGAMGFFVDWR
jgi:TolB protein